MRSAYLTGLGTSFPGPAIEQSEIWDGYFEPRSGGDLVARRIFASAGVDRRHSAVNPLVEDVSGWSTGERMRRYAVESVPMGKEAVAAALDDARLPASDVGLLEVVSCTGYSTPGLDIRVAADLGLPPDAQRLVVGHMGCYAAIPGLGTVADFVVSRGRPAVALCCELTSLHVQPADGDRGQVVSHALFGDAAAAVTLVPDPADGALEVLDVAAVTDPSTSDHMTWEVTDLGFRMGLSPEVPRVLARHVRGMVTGLLDRNGLSLGDVDGWAVHPGGPRILDVVAEQLELAPGALDASRAVLAERGNCSSATVLLVLDALRSAGLPRSGRACIALAFGPGLTLYAALLRAV
ncbi:putative naringenin-chalcone synthase [Pseudonocardia sediminis]|uniref:Putative naringenin-chalcone synthase n=1 Tax=Pseudonocardia sediminis TaxID=1397368 RepID=A0A4Q7UU81_PSEST|nr:type III polyketide synthase [Pseudonocardia sediminis]RZT84574.1 putative naringenin-chalcone synthase [Pseudonocardia sediminis]